MSNAPAPSSAPKWTVSHSAGLVGLIAAMVVLDIWNPFSNLTVMWIVNIAGITAAFAFISRAITGRWDGLVVDDRNKMSLSRTQMVLWSVLVLSGLLLSGISNIRQNPTGLTATTTNGAVNAPLDIIVPQELWLMMGISTTSLIASPLIRGIKTDQTPDQDQLNKTVAKMGQVAASKIDTNGLIIVNKDASSASWADMFRGEEAGNAAQVDLAKLQMFFTTVILVVAYAVAMGSIFAAGGLVKSLPPINQGMVALLGVSHAGYLTNKAIKHTDTADPNPPSGDGGPNTVVIVSPATDGTPGDSQSAKG